jgi:hypothetical protein
MLNEGEIRERLARLEKSDEVKDEEIKALKRDRWLLIGAVAFPVLNDIVARYVGGPSATEAVIRVMGG